MFVEGFRLRARFAQQEISVSCRDGGGGMGCIMAANGGGGGGMGLEVSGGALAGCTLA